MAWTKICQLDEVAVGSSVAVLHGGIQVAIFRPEGDDSLYAVQNRCPHSGQNVLSRGIVGETCGRFKVACPLHKRCYHLDDGSAVAEGNGELEVYNTMVQDGVVYADLPELFQ